MIKIQIDPISRKVLSYTRVRKNTQIYSTDILLEDSEIPDIRTPYMYVDGQFVEITDENYDHTLEDMNAEIAGLSEVDDGRFFVKLVMEGKSLSAARTETSARKERREELHQRRAAFLEERKQKTEKHYREENKKIDDALQNQFYSAVILLIKHENRYLQEWIDWHLALGFDHMYIYDNGTAEKVTEVTEQYDSAVQEKITVIDWSGHHNHIQQDAYNHFMEHFRTDTRWGLFIDSDEFLRFTDGITTNINEFLKNYEDYTEVWGYEVEYNANGQEYYEDAPVRERFTKQVDTREGFYWKNFIQVNRIDSFLMHYAYYDERKHLMFKNEQSNQDLFVIDHYYTKSWEEWQWKIKERGGADPRYHKALKEFFLYNPELKYLDTGENAHQAYE